MSRVPASRSQCSVKTSRGTFLIEWTSHGLYAVHFPGKKSKKREQRVRGAGAAEKIRRYFKDPREPFGSIRLDLSGCTTFAKDVYAALRRVPAGQVISYGALARRAGYPGAARAVGTAMRKNRIPIVIPCHRVVPSSGGLGTYSAGRCWKQFFLKHENSSALLATRNEQRKHKSECAERQT